MACKHPERTNPAIGIHPLRLALAVTIISAATVFSGCDGSKRPGQIFVVTQGRENVKMGAVTVVVIPARERPKKATPSLHAYEQLAQQRRTGEAQNRATDQALDTFETEISASSSGVPHNTVLDLVTRSSLHRATLAKEHIEMLEKGDDQARALMDDLMASGPFAVAKTDADGRFVAKARPGDWILAQSSRKLFGGKDENYIWASQVPEGDDPLIISNDSLLNTFHSIGLFLAHAAGLTLAEVAEQPAVPKPEISEWCESSRVVAHKAAEVARRDAENARIAAEREKERIAAEREAERMAKIRRDEEARAEATRLAEERARQEAEKRAAVEAAKAAEIARAEKARTPSAGERWHSALLNIDLLPIAPGTYQMGSAAKGMFTGNERPITTVTLTEPFWLAPTAVTQAQFEAVMGRNPSNTRGANNPVENVSWVDAMEFCRRLTTQEHEQNTLRPEFAFSLPTEAQREYACRAGSTKEYEGDLGDISWYGSILGSTHPVALKHPNAWGLYDMQGNVYEWCLDWYGPYPGGNAVDPTGPTTGTQRVVRGGAWNCPAGFCRASFRYKAAPGDTALNIGFRVAVIRTTEP